MAAKVAELMTAEVITVAPGDSVEQIMGLMTSRRIRHLPVVSEGRVVGIVSIGDIVKAQIDNLAVENRFMKDYIRG
jgi:CBS domain-containing protein